MENVKKNSVTKLLGTIAIGGTLVAGLLASTSAHAASCELADGKTLSGNYIQNSMLDKSKSSGGLTMVMKQNGCELRVTGSAIHTYMEYIFDAKNPSNSKTKPVTRKYPGGTWILDLSGQKKAVIPREYIQANAINEQTIKMTKSLEIYTTLEADGKLQVKALFDFDYDGTVVKVQVTTSLNFYAGNVSYAENVQKFSGHITSYDPVKVRVIPQPGLAENRDARARVIAYGANWFLEAFENQMSSMLRIYELSFMRQ